MGLSCRILWGLVLVLMAASTVSSAAFCSPRSLSSSVRCNDLLKSKFVPTASHTRQRSAPKSSSSSSSLNMFMGSEGGILGVGAPEVFTILLVGYFVLGPSDLYKVVKEIGKFLQSFRTLSTDLTKTVETNLESQLELEEIRKAQRELTDAFAFRRTINVDEDTDPFTTKAGEASAEQEGAAATAATATAAAVPGKKKKIRKRLKKRVVEEAPPPPPEEQQPMPAETSGKIEDLDMTAAFKEEEAPPVDEDAARLREERMERLAKSGGDDWAPTPPSVSDADEQERFAAQMSSSWNEQILANEDKLSPLSKVMERLAILEEEKNAADARLEEEFRLRAELEEKYYKEKRQMLEEAAVEVQADAYVGMENKNEGNNSTAVQA